MLTRFQRANSDEAAIGYGPGVIRNIIMRNVCIIGRMGTTFLGEGRIESCLTTLPSLDEPYSEAIGRLLHVTEARTG